VTSCALDGDRTTVMQEVAARDPAVRYGSDTSAETPVTFPNGASSASAVGLAFK
jgi:hypothetical protein